MQWVLQCANTMLKMDKKKVFILIFLCFLVSNAVCKEEPNHVSTDSHSEVSVGFKNPSARHADGLLRSKQHKFHAHTSPNTDSFTSDDERIGSLDGKILPESNNGLKTMKLTTDGIDDMIQKVLIKRKFAMKRSAKKHKLKMLSSSQGAKMPSSASHLGNGKRKDAFTSPAFSNIPPSSATGEPYKTKIHTPFKLTVLPTEKTVTPSVDTTDAESNWILTQDDTAKEEDEQKSSQNDDKHGSLPHGEPTMTGHEGSKQHGGTSATSQHKMAVYPGMKTSSGLRWNVAHEYAKLDESKKGKHAKKKKTKSDSGTEDTEHSDSSAATVAGILAGILMLLIAYTGAPSLWRIFKKRWRRRNGRVLGLNIPSTGYFSEDMSEEEIIFDRAALGRNKTSFMDTSTKSALNTSPRRTKSTPASYQSTDPETQQQKIWTLTDTPKSTPLMAVLTPTDTPSSEVWMVNEIPESKSLDSSFTTSSLSDITTGAPTETPQSESLASVSSVSLTSDMNICDFDLASSTSSRTPPCDKTEKTVPSFLPFTTESSLDPSTSSASELTVPDMSLSPNPPSSKESSTSSLLLTASDEMKGFVSMATGSGSASPSTESCKTPVASRNDVVIAIGDDDHGDEKVFFTSGKLQSVELNMVNDVGKETSRENVVIRLEYDDDQDQYEASSSPWTLPTIPPTTASTQLRKGKSLIGGRKALENRRFIKHLISEQEPTGFKHDLDTAISRILGEKKPLVNKNKGKRNVIKHQTQETKYSLTESILRAKSLIMNEDVDKERNRRSFLCRQTIKQTLSYPVRPAVRPQRTLAREIAFAKEIILPGHAHPRAASVRTKVKRGPRCGDKSINPLNSGASSGNFETRTKYMNHKDYQNWKLLLKDAEVKKAKGIKLDVSLPSLKQVASFFDIPISDVRSDVTVCQCYYCDKYRKKELSKRMFNLPRFQRV